ncbi:MAG: flagellar hook-associated protein FlgL, partial [Clostridiales bacterium]|nr:flagellar hook-associated protein FlgL [Clostridiales bacterium]
MRITNKMMTNNMMSNINKNKLYMSKLEQQYSSDKKIQRPSEDPIIAVRALKLRTNLSELKQYHEKNIPDAMSWMDVTEAALTTINTLLSNINTYCVQGSTDTLTAKDRSAIVQNLEHMKAQIYNEGNTNYAGRYVFTGYKTDNSLIFDKDRTDLSYTITEKQTSEQIEFGRSVV